MARNNDPRIVIASELSNLINKIDWVLIRYRKWVMKRKLKHIYKEGDKVFTTFGKENKKYYGIVVSVDNWIYSNGENGFVQVKIKFDEPMDNWKDGIFGVNQKFVEKDQRQKNG